MKRISGWIVGVVAVAVAPAAWGAVKPHALFTPGAVLQQGRPVPVWGTGDEGEKVTVKFADKTATATTKDGVWMAWLPALAAGTEGTLTIEGTNRVEVDNVAVGEVWLCSGQSNMQWPLSRSADPDKTIAAANHPKLRLFSVPHRGSDEPQTDLDAAWAVCTPESAKEFSAVGYHFGKALHDNLKVPIGLINVSVGGSSAEAWTNTTCLTDDPELAPTLARHAEEVKRFEEQQTAFEKKLAKWKEESKAAKENGQTPPDRPRPPDDPRNLRRKPAACYNGMLKPLQPFAIAGAIWYQGESNAGRARQYATLFPAMIRNWRADWGQGDFPFLFVQLAPFMKIVDQPGDSAWAELREAQRSTTHTVPVSAMAVITDVGEENDIHPQKKEPVGKRLALAAQALGYGQKVVYSGPEYSRLVIDGDKAIVHFDHVGGGLVAKDGELAGFTIAGADGKFYPGQAKIEKETVVVTSPDVPAPVAVRYGWANYPVVNLFNAEGLPASPFRTDNLPWITRGQY